MYDELLAVNGTDVSQMDHGDIVALIKSSGLTIHLSVQQPEDLDLVNRQQMVTLLQPIPQLFPICFYLQAIYVVVWEGCVQTSQFVTCASSCQQIADQQQAQGWSQQPQSAPSGQYQEDRRHFQDFPGMEDDVPPQISADLSDIAR